MWQRRAQLALQVGDEGLAREALRRKQAEQATLERLQDQLDKSQPLCENLLKAMGTMEGRLEEAKANRAQLLARAKAAKTSRWVYDSVAGLDVGSAAAAFKRMEEKVQQLEVCPRFTAQEWLQVRIGLGGAQVVYVQCNYLAAVYLEVTI